ncbi:MAG: hypothetical protein LBO02_03415 [Holosporaceae bacterium]|jgi:hypothetical protein|nr:hypothetical protein [Holosporaceae bacterium]
MNRLLFYIFYLLLTGIVCDFQNYVFAEEDDEIESSSEESENQEESNDGKEEKIQLATSEIDTKDHVKSIVDSLLKINKHVNKPNRDPKTVELLKNHALSKQLSEIKNQLNGISKALNLKTESSSENKEKAQDHKKKKRGKSSYRRRKSRDFYSSPRIYTVKNIRLPINAGNSYIYKTSSPQKSHSAARHTEEREYKIKLFGNNSQTIKKSFGNTYKFTNKSGDYFSQKSNCMSPSGCSDKY